jgi:hypothetical protein
MLGTYDNFPNTTHKTAHFTTSTPSKKLQQTLIQAISETNGKSFNLEDLADPSVPQCTATLEFGIADTRDFNYLDKEETNRVLKNIQKNPLEIMDFYCAIRYYKTKNAKKTPLRFDYYLTRFLFKKNFLEIQVFHEKGPRHMTPQDIINLAENKINAKFSRITLKP